MTAAVPRCANTVKQFPSSVSVSNHALMISSPVNTLDLIVRISTSAAFFAITFSITPVLLLPITTVQENNTIIKTVKTIFTFPRFLIRSPHLILNQFLLLCLPFLIRTVCITSCCRYCNRLSFTCAILKRYTNCNLYFIEKNRI